MDNVKRLKYIIITVGFVLLVSVVTVVTLSLINNKQPKKSAEVTQETADGIKSQALEALEDNDEAKAKLLLLEAKEQYETLDDKDNAVDTDAQIYLLEHSDTDTN